MLGAVGCSPVVSPHRIKQACQPYQVVKVATECGLLARSTNEVWRRGKTVMIPLYFRLCYVFSCSAILRLQRTSHRSTLCIALVSAHRQQPMHWHKSKCNKKKYAKPIPFYLHARRHWLDTIYPKGIKSLFGHQKIVRGRFSTFASQPVV